MEITDIKDIYILLAKDKSLQYEDIVLSDNERFIRCMVNADTLIEANDDVVYFYQRKRLWKWYYWNTYDHIHPNHFEELYEILKMALQKKS